MRRLLAAMVLVLLFAPRAWAQQRYLQPQVQPAPAATLTPAQTGYDTATLLALYMSQLATSGRAPSQSDISEAARQYFTNGAAVSTVPTSGPGAAYFQNGAAAMSYGAAPAPTAPASPPVVQPAAVPVPVPVPVPASAPDETATSGAAPADTSAPASTMPGVTEAQAANPSSQSAGAPPAAASATPAPPVQPIYQTIVVSTPPAQPAPEAEPEATCPPPPSLLSRIAPAFGGLLFGGFAVALWTRPRMLRNRDR
jgi:hypothetical protein